MPVEYLNFTVPVVEAFGPVLDPLDEPLDGVLLLEPEAQCYALIQHADVSLVETRLDPLLQVKDLRLHFYTDYGVVQALMGVNFEVHRDEIFGLVGETGCGKSVTSLSILRLVPHPGRIISGEIIFEGRNLLELSDEEIRKIRGSQIAMIFQDPASALDPVYTVGDQISEAITAHNNRTRKQAWDKSVEMLELVKIPSSRERVKQYPHEFSGGMKQRVMIAMALSSEPKLLIADEPTTNLDVTTQAQIFDLMIGLKEEFKSSILLITHDLGVIAETCNRVGVMYAGHVVEIGTVNEVYKYPKHPYTEGLIGAIPTLEESEMLKTIPGLVPSMLQPPKGCPFHPRCKYSTQTCQGEMPLIEEIEKEHWVSCYHPIAGGRQ